jgi:pimeloyl-ACP methyl ester carboxylesterase
VKLHEPRKGVLVALKVALERPDLVNRLVLISCAFHSNGMIVRPTADVAPPPQLVAAYDEVSPDGGEYLPVVIAKIAQSLDEDPGIDARDLKAVSCRTLVVAADDDIVTLEHTVALYRGIPDAQLAILPEATHLLLLEKPKACTDLVTQFLTSDPSPTFMPIRRSLQTTDLA